MKKLIDKTTDDFISAAYAQYERTAAKPFVPKSKIYRIALYVHHVLGKHTFTSADLMAAGQKASQWYTANIDPNVLTRKAEILAKYDQSDEKWLTVMQHAGSFYFAPDANVTACNNEIKALFANVPHVNNPPYYDNYCRALVNVAVRRGQFQIVKRGRAFTYRINPDYVAHPFA